jgi:hypothetical protein
LVPDKPLATQRQQQRIYSSPESHPPAVFQSYQGDQGVWRAGILFADNPDHGSNPCCEIMLNPVVTIKENREIARLRQLGYTGPLAMGQRLTGFQMCNLKTINASAASTPDKFYELCDTRPSLERPKPGTLLCRLSGLSLSF